MNIEPGQTRHKSSALLLALVLLFLLVPSSLQASAAETRVRVLHLAPGTGPIEVWVEGRLIDEGMEFRGDTGYVEITPGENRIVSKTVGGEDSAVVTSLFPYREGKDYTVSLTGRGREDLQLVISIDSCPPSESLAQLTFTDGVPDSLPMDVSIKYGPNLYERLSFRTGGGCRLIPPDDYVLEFTESRSGRRLAEKEISLKEGTRHNLFATGDDGPESLELFQFERLNKPEREPKVLGVEKSVLQLLGAGLIASVFILLLGQ